MIKPLSPPVNPKAVQFDILKAEEAIDAALNELVRKHGGTATVQLSQHAGGVTSNVALTFTRPVVRPMRLKGEL